MVWWWYGHGSCNDVGDGAMMVVVMMVPW
jgi:hypothetical protein